MSLSRFDFFITYRPGKQQGLSNVLLRRLYLAPNVGEATFDQVCAATIGDLMALHIKRHHGKGNKFKVEKKLLYSEERIYIPKGLTCLRVLQSRHDFQTVGYFRYYKTLEFFSRDFWLPKMWKDVNNFVTSYDICLRSKNPQHRPYKFAVIKCI